MTAMIFNYGLSDRKALKIGLSSESTTFDTNKIVM